MSLNELSATQASELIRKGEITSEKLIQACLDRIEQVDGDVEAWAHLNPEHALEQARMRDKIRMQGHAIGPLHGIPVGIKDIIDTAHVPTEYGSKLYSGRVPFDDAWVINRLRQAGAIIIGKTVTAELANAGPGKTRNPHNPDHTPGGSSSGSAAAVASYMAPCALGTQTGGSVIRPASFCGVYGFKPTYGMIPRSGILMQSHFLDQVGTFARTIDDIALLTELLFGWDQADTATSSLIAPSPLSKIAAEEPPTDVKLAFVRTPVWDQAEPATQEAFAELRDAFGNQIDEISLPATFDEAVKWHRHVMSADDAEAYAKEYAAGEDAIHPDLRAAIEEGREVRATDYISALKKREVLNELLSEIFDEYDAIITPAAIGEAPKGLDSTGNPAFCSIWSFCGTPALSMPLMQGETGLPLGVQFIGRWGDDARLLRTANWFVRELNA